MAQCESFEWAFCQQIIWVMTGSRIPKWIYSVGRFNGHKKSTSWFAEVKLYENSLRQNYSPYIRILSKFRSIFSATKSGAEWDVFLCILVSTNRCNTKHWFSWHKGERCYCFNSLSDLSFIRLWQERIICRYSYGNTREGDHGTYLLPALDISQVIWSVLSSSHELQWQQWNSILTDEVKRSHSGSSCIRKYYPLGNQLQMNRIFLTGVRFKPHNRNAMVWVIATTDSIWSCLRGTKLVASKDQDRV